MRISLPDGRRVEVAEFGDEKGVPALWLHGAASCRLEAGGLAEEARAAGVRLLAADRAGVGGSDPCRQMTVPSYADDVVAVLDELCIEKATIAGLSNGGMYAMAVGALHPGRVSHVVAVNSASPVADAAVTAALAARSRASYAVLRRWPGLPAKRAGQGPGRVAESLARLVGPDADVLKDPAVATRAAQTRAELRRQPHSDYLLREVTLALGRWGFDHRVVPVPVVLVSGDKDAGLGYARVWARELPNAKLVTMQGGHVGLFRPENRRLVASLLVPQ